MPPGVPGREPYNPVEGHGPFQTDPEKAKQILADSGNKGFELKFLFSTDSRRRPWPVRTCWSRVSRRPGSTATPIATTLANNVADRDDVNGTINMRSLRLVLRLAVGRDLGAADLPVDGRSRRSASAPTSRRSINPEIDAKIEAVYGLRPTSRPTAWNALEQEIMTTSCRSSRGTTAGSCRCIGSQIEGHRHRQHPGHAVLPRHLGERRLSPVQPRTASSPDVVGAGHPARPETGNQTLSDGGSAMFGYIVRRLMSAFLVIVLTSMIVFLLFFKGPSNPAQPLCDLNGKCTAGEAGPAHRAARPQRPGGQRSTPSSRRLLPRPDDHFGATYHCDAPCLGISYRTARR